MAPEGLVEVRVSWPGHPRYLKKKKRSLFDKDILLLLGMAACAFGVAIGYIGPIRIRNFIPISS